MGLNLHAWMLFYTVASTGSVTEAAKRLNISQPAISTQIRNLEKQYQVALFEKKGRNLVLTPFGQKLYVPIEQLFSLEEQISGMIADRQSHPEGKLKICGNYLASSMLIPKWAALFKQKYPEVKVEISTANSEASLEKLGQFAADIAILGENKVSDRPLLSYQRFELFSDQFVFVVAPGHKHAGGEISLTEMLKEPFIMREEGSNTRNTLAGLCKLKNVSPPTVELQFNGLHEVIQAVAAGYGASFVSSLAADPFIRHGELALVHVKGVKIGNKIVLCSHKRDYLEGYVRDFIAIALKQARS